MTSISQDHNLDYTFARHFVTLRTALGLTQSALAQQLGVTERAIQRWEGGTRYPKVEYLKAFLVLCIEHHAFPAGREVELARTLWKAAHLKVLFDEHWILGFLHPQVPQSSMQDPVGARMPQSLVRPVDWGEEVSEVSFYGRESERAQLTTWIQEDRCRLIALLGMGGIGKSALAVTLLHQLSPFFSIAAFRSVRDAIPCEELVVDLIQTLAPEPLSEIPGSLTQRITLLLKQMQTRRCFFVLDNVETLLQEGEHSGGYRVGYEGYGRLFERIGTTQHQSCVVLTSREKPVELKSLEGSQAPVRSLHLAGLDEGAGEQILQEKQLRGEAEAKQRLIDAYSGNPLALKIVAETIRELFAGEITPFLAEGQIIFQGVRALLAQQFARLPFLAQSVLFWLAIVRESVDVTDLLSRFITQVPRLQLLEALEDLRRRSLVEHGQQRSLFTLQSVVLEFVTDTLVQQIASEVQRREPDALLSYALSLASAKEYIRQTQERLLLAPVLFHLGASQPRKGVVEQQLLRSLELLRSYDVNEQGYGPSNVAMLLVHLNGHLKGINFSGCRLREANLRVEMQDARLAEANVRNSVFTEFFEPATAVAISKNGQYWAVAGTIGNVRVWEWGQQSNQILHLAWPAHNTNIYGLAWSPDGRLATGGWDNTVKLWEVERATLLWTGWHDGQVNHVVFSPDGHFLASGGTDGLVRLWDTENGTQVQQLAGQDGVINTLDWSPDGKWLASGATDGSIWMWEPEMLEPDIHAQQLLGHTNWVQGLAFSPDSAQLASVSSDGTVKLWEMGSGNCLQTFIGHADQVMCVAWSPDGRTLASGGWNSTIFLWDIMQGRARAILKAGDNIMITSLAFTSDSRTLLSSSKTVRIWDVEHAQCLRTIDTYLVVFLDIDWSPDGHFLASSSSEGQIMLWKVAPVPSKSTLRGHSESVQGVAWSPDGHFLASSGNDGCIGLWNATTGACLEMLRDPDPVDTLFLSVAWSPDGCLLASGSFLRGVQVWDIAAHTRIWVGQTPQPTRIHHIAWSPDGTQLVGAGWDGTVYLWNAADGRLLRQMVSHNWGVRSVIWSPDGKWLASVGAGKENGEIMVWEAQSGEQVRVLVGHTWATFAVAWSPDGKKLISGGGDGMLYWWEIDSGQRTLTQKAHQGMVYALKVSPNGRILASCGDDSAIHLWDIESGKHLQTLPLERLYERLDISGIQGITEAQKMTLRALGAIEG